jgi:hypothetical protein
MSIFDSDSTEDDEKNRIEENYKESVYPSAMKDFIHIGDFKRVMRKLMEELKIDPGLIDLESMTGARSQLERYEKDLEQGDA